MVGYFLCCAHDLPEVILVHLSQEPKGNVEEMFFNPPYTRTPGFELSLQISQSASYDLGNSDCNEQPHQYGFMLLGADRTVKLSEDFAAKTDHICPFLDGNPIGITHAHGQVFHGNTRYGKLLDREK